jgi:RNA polymerase sigma-70 factor (ECF subfamily)
MVSTVKTENRLVERAVAGDADAFGELYSRYLDAIYRYIFFRIGEQREAEDLTENVFLKAWEALPGYKDFGNPFSSWLYRIAHNIVVDYHRKIKPIIHEGDSESIQDQVIDEAANTLTVLIEAEDLQALAKAINQLTSEQQQVIILRFIEELSHAEISKIIGKNEGTCRMIQHRALTALNRLLDEKNLTSVNG